MLAREPDTNLFRFGNYSSSQNYQSSDPAMLELTNTERTNNSSWSKREFSSDEDSFMTSSVTQSVTSVTSVTQTPFFENNNPGAFSFESEFYKNSNFSFESKSPQGIPPLESSDVGGSSDDTKRDICFGCNLVIMDRFVHQISGFCYHEECSKCSTCDQSLTSSCYVRDGKLYCKEDYLRACKICSGCNLQIQDGEMVMRLMTSCHVYHVTCFTCVTCRKHLKKGDKYVIKSNNETNNNDVGASGVICQSCLEGSNCDVGEKSLEESQEPMTSQTEPMTSQASVVLCHNEQSDVITPNMLTVPTSIAASSSPENSDVIDSLMSPKSQLSVMSPKSDDVGDSSDDEEKEMMSYNTSSTREDSEDKDSNDKDEYDVNGKRSKRPRTILNAVQRRAFKAAFELSPKPCRKVREALASETGLTVRVVQVWFQNQRAKMKKLAKRQQSQEHAAQMKAREQYGYHGYDPMTPLQHQIPSIFPHSDAIMEHGYGRFPPHPMWEQMHGPPYQQVRTFPESIGYREHMTSMDDLQHSISPSHFNEPNNNIYQNPQLMITANHLDEAPVNQLQLTYYEHKESMGGQPVRHIFPTNDQEPHLDVIDSTPIMNSHEMGTPINGLYSMQNNYFSSS